MTPVTQLSNKNPGIVPPWLTKPDTGNNPGIVPPWLQTAPGQNPGIVPPWLTKPGKVTPNAAVNTEFVRASSVASPPYALIDAIRR